MDRGEIPQPTVQSGWKKTCQESSAAIMCRAFPAFSTSTGGVGKFAENGLFQEKSGGVIHGNKGLFKDIKR